MISLGAKFADYGLTGGFAIVGQATLLGWVAPDTARSIVIGSAQILGEYFDCLPASLVTPAAAVMTTVGLISIFFLGLVLEAIGSIAVIWEVNVFKSHLERHRSWLSDLLAEYPASAVEDFRRLVSEFGSFRGDWRESLGILTLWRRSSRQSLIEYRRRVFRRFRLLGLYSRTQALLLSYVLAADIAPPLDLIRDNVQLCRTSRAVSAALYIFSFEVYVAAIMALVRALVGFAEFRIFYRWTCNRRTNAIAGVLPSTESLYTLLRQSLRTRACPISKGKQGNPW
jgi:hypothetical protein